jgi:hypothetical protein
MIEFRTTIALPRWHSVWMTAKNNSGAVYCQMWIGLIEGKPEEDKRLEFTRLRTGQKKEANEHLRERHERGAFRHAGMPLRAWIEYCGEFPTIAPSLKGDLDF